MTYGNTQSLFCAIILSRHLNPKLEIIRNIETYIGAWVAGKGVPYKIIIYGEQKLKQK